MQNYQLRKLLPAYIIKSLLCACFWRKRNHYLEDEDGIIINITIKLHYSREDGDYTGWNVWAWALTTGGSQSEFQEENGEMVASIVVDSHSVNSVSYIVRKGQWEEQEFGERRVDVSRILGGTVHCYVVSGCPEVKTLPGEDAITGNKLLAAEFDYDSGCLLVHTSMPVEDDTAFTLCRWDGKATDIAISGIQSEDCACKLALSKPLSLVELYRYAISFGGHKHGIHATHVYASDKFEADFTYEGDDLGAVWAPCATTFKVWAPTAEAVELALYASGEPDAKDLLQKIPMTRQDKGVWAANVEGDLNGTYYTYLVSVGGKINEACDPYARATGVNGQRAMVIDLSATNPAGWASDCNPNPLKSYTDAVLYELHVRDFSVDESSGISRKNQGKFLAFTESGTKTAKGTPTCLEHLKSLGITHLHLLPVYDYASVDESHPERPQFNWGYDPLNFNTPEGSYSTDARHGHVRVQEMKQAVQALHNAGISVVMDVVYNHVFEAGTFCLNKIVPGYFSRVNADGSNSNGSGCGNDTASERSMVRKFIVDSIVYWCKEYHIDGFRFDLVGLLDTDTINALVEAVHATRPDAIFYGEGWDLPTACEPGTHMAIQPNAFRTPQFAYFCDDIRNLLAGENGKTLGFVSGLTGKEEAMHYCFTGNVSWCPQPTQTVNYVSCHDNYTLMDKLAISCPDASRSQRIRMGKMAAAIYMLSQGIPFIHAGEEMLREKLDEQGNRVENSYNRNDFVNAIRWSDLDKPETAATVDYYRGLIAFRKAHPALRLATAQAISDHVTYRWIDNEVIAFDITGDIDGEPAKAITVILNATDKPQNVTIPEGDWSVCINGEAAGTRPLATVTGDHISVEPTCATVLVR